MNNNATIKTALCLMLSVCTVFIGSCASQNDMENETSAEYESEEIFVPAENNGESGSLFERYSAYKKNSEQAFKNNAPLGADMFEYVLDEDGIRITKYTGSEPIVVIPDVIDGHYVKCIAEGAFSGVGIRAVYIPDSVERLETRVFSECDGLSTLRIPFIGDGGENTHFGYIFGADEPDENVVTVPPSLDMVILGENCFNIADEAFKGCKTISAVVFEEKIECIGRMAFFECSDLVYITLDMAIGAVGEYCFAFCSSLYYADVSNADNVGSGAFYLCTSINGIKLIFEENDYLGRYFGAGSPDYNDEFVPESLRKLIIGEGCRKIPDRAVGSCKNITDVILPQTLIEIGVRAFYACRSLGSIDITPSVKLIEDDAFFGCDNLSEIIFGNSLEAIGMQAFYGCKRLEEVQFPKSLRTIGASAFYGCIALENADVSEDVTVGKDAFGNCQRLDAE